MGSVPPRRRRAALVVAVLAVVAVVVTVAAVVAARPDMTSRSGGPGGDPAEPGSGELKRLWSTEVPVSGQDVWVRRSGDTVALVGPTSVVGVDRGSGDQQWSVDLPGRCATSEVVGEGLVVAVTGQACEAVTALDLESGRRLWTARLRTGGLDDRVLGASDRTVTVGGDCTEVERFALADGSRLAPPVAPVPRDRCPGGQVGTDGRTVVIHREGGAAGVLLAVDADTGRRLWERPSSPLSDQLAVWSSDPLVITADAGDAGVVTRRYDARTGRPGPVLVRGGFGVSLIDVVQGVALGRTQSASAGTVLRAYDLGAGRQLWAHEIGIQDTVVGTDDGGVLVAAPVEDDPAEISVTRLGRADGEQELLGRLATSPAQLTPGSLQVAGDLLVGVADGRLTAYSLPPAGEGEVVEPQDVGPPTADDVLDACTAVRPATLRMLGVRTAAPAPFDCTWHEYLSGPERRLEVQVHAGVESSYETAVQDAAGWARDQAALLQDATFAPTFVTPPAGSPVRGWGDEAWVSQAFAPTGTDSFTGVVVRVGSIAVSVQAHTEAPFSGSGRVAGYQLQRAVRDAATDVITGLGIRARPPGGGRAGPVTTVPDVCTALADVGVARGGGEQPTRPGPTRDPDRRVGGCEWGDVLTVTAYALPGSVVDASTGPDLAEAAYADACLAADRRVRGLGDDACVREYSGDGGEYRSRSLTVRRGNLLVAVELGLDGFPSPAELDAAVEEVGRAAVDRLG